MLFFLTLEREKKYMEVLRADMVVPFVRFLTRIGYRNRTLKNRLQWQNMHGLNNHEAVPLLRAHGNAH